MPLNFPTTGLTANQTTYTFSGNTWIWNGYAWDSVSVGGTGSGTNGATGATGSQGATGPQGATGATGPAGVNFLGYDYEIHVSQVDGNDTTGNGDLLTPVASITKALTLVDSQRKTIIVHPGTYTESPSITVQYTTITGPGLIGGNIVISGTVSTNTGCTISGIKMTNLTVTTPSGAGNVNILNCEVSGTFTKSSNADYTVLRLCDLTSASITGAGLVAIFGGNPNYITVNNASANVIVKSAVTVSPVLTAGVLSIVDCVVGAAVTNAVTSAASSVITLANSQLLTSALTDVAPVVLNGFYSILNCVYNKATSTLAASSGTGGTLNSIDYFQYINADKFITQGGTSTQFVKGDGSLDSNCVISVNGLTGAISSIAVTGSNTFTGLQTMNAGITANNLWVTNGATFAARSTFVNGLSADTLWATNGVTFSSNLYAGTIKGGLLNVQNTGNNLLGDVVGVLGGGYIQVDNSSGVAVNKIAGTVYTDQIRAGGAVSVTGAISASTTITATGRMSNAGMTATGAVAFTSSVTANNLYVSQGVTFNSTSVYTGLATFNAGITSNNLWVTNGATFANNIFAPNIVNSVNGITGAVGITAGSNITITQSGLTFTISSSAAGGGSSPLASASVTGVASFGNEFVVSALGAVSLTANYVKSVNGSTGAIVSVAVTGSNTFTGLQTMNAGITANNLSVTQGATFAGTVSSDTGYRISSSAVNAQTGTTYSLTASDNGKIVTMNNAATSTVTVIGGLPIGFNTTVIQLGAGQVGFTAASGVTLNSYSSATKIAGQHGAASVISYTTNIYNLSGTLTI